MIQVDTWTNCYDLNWKGLICDAAFSHPAKFSRGLIFRIIEHALEEGWIQPGGVVLDPFSGVACGALPCLQAGLHYVGVELEEKFITLARENIALWNDRYAAHFPNWGSAQVYQGDSRRLAEVVGAAGLVVSSPPYVDSMEKSGGIDPDKSNHIGGPHSQMNRLDTRYGETDGQLGAMPPGSYSAVISSPSFAGNSGGRGEASRNGIDPGLFDRHSGGMKGGTGSDPTNLDHLPMGTPPIAIVSSPPYAESLNSEKNGIDWTKTKKDYPGRVMHEERIANMEKNHNERRYGTGTGQLGAMKPGVSPAPSLPCSPAIISSPPFADSVGSDDPDKRGGLFRDEKRRNDTSLTGTYGETEGQLGGMKAGVAVVGSPPFENSLAREHVNQTGRREMANKMGVSNTENISPIDCRAANADYGSTAGQIGATQGDTFWAAARLIVEQCALLLPTNGVAIWVVKNYIKNGAEVDFTGQWQALCEACGFETVHIHRAMLVKDNGEQETMAAGHDTTGTTTNLLGEQVTTAGKPMLNKKNIVARKSFFRRLHERKNPHLAIDYETVLCMRKAA